ncbi:hypothetical protein NPIL_507151 [Nephila pilipes]|uniref:Uncharacterized protein n=1 Tax=Nephila pilipes TaxID=299642 RepID=A0A8X6QTQ9_NEPPI|nr:hypothetical protein NPIL_507151 [Nephila pilipes]
MVHSLSLQTPPHRLQQWTENPHPMFNKLAYNVITSISTEAVRVLAPKGSFSPQLARPLSAACYCTCTVELPFPGYLDTARQKWVSP